jgi:hypothetical protein
MKSRLRRGMAVLVAGLIFIPSQAFSWNANANRRIAEKAIDTLPDDLRPFFESNRRFLVQHVTDPLDELAKNPAERRNHYIHLDHYGPYPYSALPRDYKVATHKYWKSTVDAQGELPWAVGLYSQKLTDAFRGRRWDEVRLDASALAYYVSEAHDPFNTTLNDDGRLSGQPQVNLRFDSKVFDRYSQFSFASPGEAVYIQDPTDHAFEMCLTAHSWLETVLLADRRARQGLTGYTDEYYDRFYNQAGSVVVHQISDAAMDVGSYWMTAWINAGRPAPPAH